tara:strand:+ start:1294 stop:1512 length:219 start_codon:yes stop_codon:yes gene_type:complete
MYYLEVRDPVEKVFTIPELRLIILSYALEDKTEKPIYIPYKWYNFTDEAWKQLTWIGLCVLFGMVLLSMLIR